MLEQFVSSIAKRIPETFIGNNKKITTKDIKKSKLGVQKPKAKKTVKAAKPKTAVKQKLTKIPRATLNQKMCVYAICMNLYNKKDLAKQVANSVAKSMDLADKKIKELKQIQASRLEVAK